MDLTLETPPKRIVNLPVNKNIQTEDFRINRVWLEALPYEDGDHCAFYAVQEALIHFNQSSLNLPTRTKFEQERLERIELYKKISGVDHELGAPLKLSLTWLLPKLEKEGIIPTKFVCADITRHVIENTKQLNRYSGIIRELADHAKTNANELFPALFFLEREDGPHVWFCPDKKTFASDQRFHKRPTDRYVLIAKMAKK